MAKSKVNNKVIVLDLEAVCDENEIFPNETTEIIQIGFCLFDMVTQEITDKTSIYIKPSENAIITDYCTTLTGITQEILNNKGISLQDVNNILIEKYKSKKRIVATFGKDLTWYKSECDRKDIEFPFWQDNSIDVHLLFKLKNQNKRGMGLLKCLNFYDIEFDGNAHDASVDAYNTAILLKELLK